MRNVESIQNTHECAVDTVEYIYNAATDNSDGNEAMLIYTYKQTYENEYIAAIPIATIIL